MDKKIYFLTIFILIFILLFININIKILRKILFKIMMIVYKIYSLFGYIAWNNPYPIDYPYGRENLIPQELMLKFNHIAYYRLINGDINYGMDKMKNIINDIHTYCINNLQVQTGKKLIELSPLQNNKDYIKMQFLIKMKHPFVLKNINIKTNKTSINSKNIIEKYGNTTVVFDKDNHAFKDKLNTIKDHNAYLSNSTSFMKKHKEIINIDDIELLTTMSGLTHTYDQVFLSLIKNNGTPMHSAFSDNFFFMIEGKKKWTFWHPDYLCMVYPYFPTHAAYMASYTCLRDIDVDTNILSKYPIFKYVPYYETILEEGDVLFNPGPWWHAIRNITTTTLGFATRWKYNVIFPSPNLLQYCQLSNPNLEEIAEKLYVAQGNFHFDIDENYIGGDMDEKSVSAIEILNHEALEKCKNDNSHEWH